jgi:hypothetical protein
VLTLCLLPFAFAVRFSFFHQSLACSAKLALAWFGLSQLRNMQVGGKAAEAGTTAWTNLSGEAAGALAQLARGKASVKAKFILQQQKKKKQQQPQPQAAASGISSDVVSFLNQARYSAQPHTFGPTGHAPTDSGDEQQIHQRAPTTAAGKELERGKAEITKAESNRKTGILAARKPESIKPCPAPAHQSHRSGKKPKEKLGGAGVAAAASAAAAEKEEAALDEEVNKKIGEMVTSMVRKGSAEGGAAEEDEALHISFFDFGGQKVFYTLHHLFMSR